MEENLQQAIERVLREKTWMTRADNNGVSPSPEANGFRLPDNLRVGGILNLNRTQITALPDNLRAGRFIHR